MWTKAATYPVPIFHYCYKKIFNMELGKLPALALLKETADVSAVFDARGAPRYPNYAGYALPGSPPTEFAQGLGGVTVHFRRRLLRGRDSMLGVVGGAASGGFGAPASAERLRPNVR